MIEIYLRVFFSALLILPIHARAGSENGLTKNRFQEVRNAWPLFFKGNIHPTLLRGDMQGLLDYKPECQAQVERILQLVDSYGIASVTSHEKKAERIYRKILKTLFQSRNSSRCLRDTGRAYIAASILIYDYSKYFYERAQAIPGHWALGLLTIALLNGNNIELLTARLRAELGGPWIKRSKSKDNYKIRGAYDCLRSKLLIDPSLRPYDLGATTIHEIDHIFRDKFLNLRTLEPFRKSGDSVDWNSYLLLDETLSTIQSAYFQKNLTTVGPTVPNDLGRGPFYTKFIGDKTLTKPYDLSKDLSFYSRTGPFVDLWNAAGGKFTSSQDFLEKTLLAQDSKVQMPDALNPSIAKIYGVIQKTYFPDAVISLETFTPDRHGNRNSPLSAWLVDHSGSFVWSRQNNLQGPWAFGFSGSAKDAGVAIDELRFLLNDLRLFADVFSRPTKLCRDFHDELKAGNLSSYAGAQFSRKEIDGIRPEIDGIRPSETVRPCFTLNELL